MFWKIYLLYDFWCAQTCSFRAILDYLQYRTLTIIAVTANITALYSDLRKKFTCTSTFSALNYCRGILFKSHSYLFEVVRTNFTTDFWTYRNFRPQFGKIVAPPGDGNANSLATLKG